MKQRVDISLQPKLIITPELQLSFELLAAPVLEVKRIVEEELMINPFLEELPSGSNLELSDESDLPWWERLPAPSKGLEEHLIEQIEVLPEVSREEKAILLEFINLIDDKGYIKVDLEKWSKERGYSVEEVERLRRLFMRVIDPAGCGAKSFKEFLEFQLHQWNIDLDILNFDPAQLVGDLREKGYIVKPYPLWGWQKGEDHFIEPDAFVVKVGSYYQVYLNERWVPRLVFNEEYRSLIRRLDLDPKVRDFLNERMKRALALLKAVEQRNKTLRRTVEVIVEFEHEFLEKGPAYLKPLSLKDVADKVGVHISTISRVVSSKYVHTPQGTYLLKYFFSDKGFEVKRRIRELIEREDKFRPLSDREIADLLNKEGFDIARRTVAKYREELGIPSSSKRRVRREKCR